MTAVPHLSAHVVWHDVECGAYRADLPLWRELADRTGGPVLDVGAGSGRVALDLAAAGHAVTALDVDPELLAALAERAEAAGLRVPTVIADAARFDLGPARFGLVIVPMQTVQLLPGRAARLGLLRAARRHLRAGGRVALALADALEDFDPDPAALPVPDRGEQAGWRFVSQPVAVRRVGGAVRIERVRETVAPDGARSFARDSVDLQPLTAAALEAEGLAAGLRPEPARRVPATHEHVASEVVVLRA
jgi:SAM-dependent methyltransferase